jgi:membrane-associated phospholipid phosphatase
MALFDTVSPDTTRPASTAADRPVRYWNDVLLDVFRSVGGPPGPLARTAAMMHGAIFDVVNNQVCTDRRLDSLPYRSYLGMLATAPGASLDDAINVAARDVLLALHPACAGLVCAGFDARYPGGSAGITSRLGQAAARAMLRARAQDGAYAGTRHPARDVPGAWRPTDDGAAADTPQWGRVTPFSFGSASTFRPPLPARLPGYGDLLGSFVYAQQVNQVKALGAAESTARGADQTETAWFWANDVDGTAKLPGHLLRLAAGLAPGGSLLAEARMFALLSFALADATVAAWDSKYEAPVSLWRPETAIRLAGTDGNACTEPAPRWRPLSADRAERGAGPSSPSYVCSHAALAGAWAAVLKDYFGTDRRAFTADTEDPYLPAGTTRTYSSFTEAATEIARSRVYLGVHFEFDVEAGLELGGVVGRHVVRTQFYRR